MSHSMSRLSSLAVARAFLFSLVLTLPARSPAQIQSTVVSGLNAPFGVAVDAHYIYIADTNNSKVVKVPVGGGPPVEVASALNLPFGVAVDATGNVYIAINLINTVIKVAPNGTQSIVSSALNHPFGVAAKGDTVYIADTDNNRVVKVAPNGTQTEVGSALSHPYGVAAKGDTVYIADKSHNRVVKVALNGTQTVVSSDLNAPGGVAVDDSGNVYIADTNNNRVVKIALNGTQTILGSALSQPSGVAVDDSGNVYIADTNNNRVVKVSVPPPPPPPILALARQVFGTPGDTVTVSLTLTNSVPIGGLQFRVTLGDVSKAAFVDLINSTANFTGRDTTNIATGITQVIFYSDAGDPPAGDSIPSGTHILGSLRYTIDPDAVMGTATSLTISQLIFSNQFGIETAGSGEGGILVVGVPGDVNLDGELNVLDVVQVIRIILSRPPPPVPDSGTTAFRIADINEDGLINVADVVMQVNEILGSVFTRVLAAGPTKPVTVSLGDMQALESDDVAVPLVLEADGVIAGLQATLRFDQALVRVGAPTLADRSGRLLVESHQVDGVLRVVVYSLTPGMGLPAGHGSVLIIPVAVLGEPNTAPSLTLSEVVLASPQAQVVPVMLGTSTVKVSALPTGFALKANRPNPFNPSTQIAYEVPQQAHVTLIVYNLLGQEVVRLVDQAQAPGRYTVTWNGRNAQGIGVASGVYMYRLTTSTGFTQSHRMTLLK